MEKKKLEMDEDLKKKLQIKYTWKQILKFGLTDGYIRTIMSCYDGYYEAYQDYRVCMHTAAIMGILQCGFINAFSYLLFKPNRYVFLISVPLGYYTFQKYYLLQLNHGIYNRHEDFFDFVDQNEEVCTKINAYYYGK